MTDLADKKSWHIDSCVSKHIINDQSLFKSLHLYFQEFYITDNALLKLTEIGMIRLSTSSDQVIQIQNVIYVSEYVSNLLSLE